MIVSFVYTLIVELIKMNIYIKNMVCPRCIMVVESEFEKLQIPICSVKLGKVETERNLSDEEVAKLSVRLEELGFELIDDKKNRLVEQVKTAIVELIYKNVKLTTNLSDFIGARLHMDYTYVSNLFSEIEGTTIEKYFIAQKIERVKELLVYDELSLSEIAFGMNYSSVAHLSSQFKKITGKTPSQFKLNGLENRKTIDKV